MNGHFLARRFLAAALVAVVCTLAPSGAEPCSVLGENGLTLGDAIGLLPDPGVPPRVLDEAIVIWKSCPSYGSGFPAFIPGTARASRTVHVRYQKIRRSPGGRKRCGSFSGNSIVLYGYVISPRGRIHHCGSLAQNLAHELGHVLGLADAAPRLACAPDVMSNLTSANLFNRRIDDEVCRAAGRRWITPAEAQRWFGLRAGTAFPFPSLALALCD